MPRPLLPLLLALAPALASPADPAAGDLPADEAELAREARLPTVLRVARARNPDLREARERAAAAKERPAAASAIPEPELQAQLWQQPMKKPFDPDAGGMVMLGLRQAFPPLGAREARGRAARADAAAAGAAVTAKEQDLIQQARKALAEYALAEQEQLIHLDHMALTSRFVELARASYQEGRLSKQAFLRASAELARVHADIAATAQARRASGAFLNTLMGRDPDAPLGPAALALPRETEFSVAEAEHGIDERPELVAAAQAVERGQAQLDGARRQASWPGLMLGADVGYMPMDGTRTYTLMAGMSLPWLWGRRGADEREAERTLAADRAALESARRNARFQVRDAKARLDSAREAFDILDSQVVPQTQQAAEAAQGSFAAGQYDALAVLDANRVYLQVRLERGRALTRLVGAVADLERAAGHLHGYSDEGKKP